MTLTQKELVILANLRQNGRESLTKMSRKTAIPISTIFEKLRLYEQGVIKKHTCILDFAKLGFKTRATILLRVAKDDRDKLKEYLLQHKAVNSFFKINNGFDFLMEAVFQEVGDVESFVERLEGEFKIEGKEVHYIIDDLKKEDFLSHPEYVKMTGAIT